MKYPFFFIWILLSCHCGAQAQNKQKTEIPIAVKEAFQKMFPDRKANWMDVKDYFEADFTTKLGAKATASYDKNGRFNELEVVIDTDDLPREAVAYVLKKYPSQRITEATRNVDGKSVVTYEVQMGNGKKSFEVDFDIDGKMLK